MVEPAQPTPQSWRVIGRSVRGATHKRNGLPNQDSIDWWPKGGEGLPVVLAVSDGHGSSKYFRSHIGAGLAVETALAVVGDFLGGQSGDPSGQGDSPESPAAQGDAHLDLSNPTEIDRAAKEHLPKLITRRWLEAVEKHIEENPLDPEGEELSKLEERDKEVAAAVRAAGKVTPVAYGATLLLVAVTASFILYAQLGDGDILIVSETEDVRRPVAGDERLIANETTSLCAKNAWNDFRVTVQPTIETEPPALILLSTDGYANSFRTEESFLQVGPDVLRMVTSSGLDSVERRLESWLNEASQAGSGDDITVGIVRRSSVMDIDMLAQTAGAALSIGRSNQAGIEKVKEEIASTNELMREQLTRLEGSLATVPALQAEIATLQKNESHYREMEQRLGQSHEAHYRALEERLERGMDKRFKKARWVVLLGSVALIAVEILAHSLWPSGSPEPARAASGATSPTPTATAQETGTPAPTETVIVTDPAATPQEAPPASASRQRPAPAAPRASGGKQKGSKGRKGR